MLFPTRDVPVREGLAGGPHLGESYGLARMRLPALGATDLLALAERPWCSGPGLLRSYVSAALDDFAGFFAVPKRRDLAKVHAGVAVVTIFGGLWPRGTPVFEEGTSTLELRRLLKLMGTDPSVRSIVLDVDSFGGTSAGVPELIATIREVGKQKKITAVVSLATGAAYWLATAAGELVLNPSGEVGGIGVVRIHLDQSAADAKEGIRRTLITSSRFKTEGHPFGPLGDEGSTEWQRQVDDVHREFVADVARGRGVTTSTVSRSFGQGRSVFGAEAVRLRMADRLGTLADTVDRLVQAGTPRRRPRALAEAPAPTSSLPAPAPVPAGPARPSAAAVAAVRARWDRMLASGDPERIRYACHEAGHAVLADVLNVGCRYAELTPESKERGGLTGIGAGSGNDLADVSVYLAGTVAECAIAPRAHWDGGRSDRENADRAAAAACPSDPKAVLQEGRSIAVEVLAFPAVRLALKELAVLLHDDGYVHGTEVARAVDRLGVDRAACLRILHGEE